MSVQRQDLVPLGRQGKHQRCLPADEEVLLADLQTSWRQTGHAQGSVQVSYGPVGLEYECQTSVVRLV